MRDDEGFELFGYREVEPVEDALGRAREMILMLRVDGDDEGAAELEATVNQARAILVASAFVPLGRVPELPSLN